LRAGVHRLDPDRSLHGLPLAPVEVAKVEVTAAGVREQQRALSTRPQLVERGKRDRLQRNGASAQPIGPDPVAIAAEE
jgi:hypothetical protein